MLKFVAVLGALIVGLGSVEASKDFEWSDCGGSIVKFNELSFNPLPLTLSETANISLTAAMTVNSDLPMDAHFELVLNKTVTLFGNDNPFELTLPCVDGMGSCSAPVCDLFNLWYADYLCPFFEHDHKPCSCPIRKGLYSVKTVPFTVPFDRIKGLMAQLSKGQYHARFTISSPGNSKTYACMNLAARLA